MKAINVIKNQRQYDNDDQECHNANLKFDLNPDDILVSAYSGNPRGQNIIAGVATGYAYLIMMDSITLPASSHLSVTISITW